MCSVQRSSKKMDESDKNYVESKVKSKKGGQRERVATVSIVVPCWETSLMTVGEKLDSGYAVGCP
jgi:hypothetical protein